MSAKVSFGALLPPGSEEFRQTVSVATTSRVCHLLGLHTLDLRAIVPLDIPQIYIVFCTGIMNFC